MDPLTIITLLSSYATGMKVSGLLSDWLYGQNITYFQNGYEYMSEGYNKGEIEFFQRAITQFDHIDVQNDRLYVIAASYYCRALCYACLLKFSLAHSFLNKLEKIEYDFFTLKKDTIEGFKDCGKALKKEIKKIEDEERRRREDEERRRKKLRRNIIILLALIGVLIIGAVLYFLLF